MTFGEILKSVFATSGVKQSEAGEKLGCTQSAVNHLLADRRSPTLNRAIAVLGTFGYKIVFLPVDVETPDSGFDLTASESKEG